MAVKKSTCERYSVSNDGEWAVICLSEYPGTTFEKRTTYGGELIIHSSFGDFAYTWTCLSAPLKKFLPRLEFSYLMGHLMGTDYLQYSREKTLASVLRRIESLEGDETFNAEQAAKVRQAVQEMVEPDMATGDAFMASLAALEDEDSLDFDVQLLTVDAHEYIGLQPSTQALGFWAMLWPEFRDCLVQETSTVQPAPQE